MKRALCLLPLTLLLAACGPSTPAEAPSATTAPTAEPAPTASATAAAAADTAAPAPTAAPEAKPAEPPPPPPPNVTATLGGKPFAPKAAITMGPVYNGRVLVAFTDYDAACGKPAEPAEGARTLGMLIEWKAGSVGFAADKKAKIGDPWYTELLKTKKLKQTAFASKGKVELAAAPTEVGKSTRVTLDLTSGKDTVKGDIELHVCWEITPEKK